MTTNIATLDSFSTRELTVIYRALTNKPVSDKAFKNSAVARARVTAAAQELGFSLGRVVSTVATWAEEDETRSEDNLSKRFENAEPDDNADRDPECCADDEAFAAEVAERDAAAALELDASTTGYDQAAADLAKPAPEAPAPSIDEQRHAGDVADALDRYRFAVSSGDRDAIRGAVAKLKKLKIDPPADLPPPEQTMAKGARKAAQGPILVAANGVELPRPDTHIRVILDLVTRPGGALAAELIDAVLKRGAPEGWRRHAPNYVGWLARKIGLDVKKTKGEGGDARRFEGTLRLQDGSIYQPPLTVEAKAAE